MSKYAIGQQVSCQMGNPSDSSGFRTGVPVTVLAMQEGLCGELYLFEEVANSDFIGVATVPTKYHTNITDQLYCTMARTVNDDQDVTRDYIFRSMGFKSYANGLLDAA